jgi:hypothetical protein
VDDARATAQCGLGRRPPFDGSLEGGAGHEVVIRADSEGTMRSIVIVTLLLSATTAIAAPAEKKARTAEQDCQAQALASIARKLPDVLQGYFEIIIKDNRCLVFLETPGVFAGRRVARMIDGKTGDMLSEFGGPKTPASAVAAAIATANFRPANALGMNIWPKPSRCSDDNFEIRLASHGSSQLTEMTIWHC